MHAQKKKSAKEQRNLEERENADYNEFLQEIEEDPEMRQNINLYKDDDVVAMLEKQLNSMTLEEKMASGKSPSDAALDAGEAKVGNTVRKVVKARRTTDKARIEQ